MKRALLVAFHFPPIRRSSGIQRTLKFATYLRDHGWQPVVLTVHPRAYEHSGNDQLGEIPEDVLVHRAFALDTARHLSVGGRYWGLLARPDRFASWIPGGILAGRRLIRSYRPAVLWSTYPVASAHAIGASLQRSSGLPWIADIRDSMTEEGYPSDPLAWRDFRRIEATTVARASRTVFTTPGARRMYAERYPAIPDERWAVIPNGYDEENFRDAARLVSRSGDGADGPVRLVHAGVLYPAERDPQPFFEAIARLKRQGAVSSASLRVVLRATGHDERYAPILSSLGIDDIVDLAPPRAYVETLAEMLEADGLLLFQAASCNHQIPAKLYEYLRAQRPILALTDRAGDTAATLVDNGVDTIVPLDDVQRIERGLVDFLQALRDGSAPIAPLAKVERYSRVAGARDLAALFDAVTASGG